jgi:nitroimidazol reductase NimA-like FMN-containing flavoprotein (pyridoxamine 5'-phosphate oxidase superfamily)
MDVASGAMGYYPAAASGAWRSVSIFGVSLAREVSALADVRDACSELQAAAQQSTEKNTTKSVFMDFMTIFCG